MYTLENESFYNQGVSSSDKEISSCNNDSSREPKRIKPDTKALSTLETSLFPKEIVHLSHEDWLILKNIADHGEMKRKALEELVHLSTAATHNRLTRLVELNFLTVSILPGTERKYHPTKIYQLSSRITPSYLEEVSRYFEPTGKKSSLRDGTLQLSTEDSNLILNKKDRRIVNAVTQLGSGTANQIHRLIPDDYELPSLRKRLLHLVRKGVLEREKSSQGKYIYLVLRNSNEANISDGSPEQQFLFSKVFAEDKTNDEQDLDQSKQEMTQECEHEALKGVRDEQEKIKEKIASLNEELQRWGSVENEILKLLGDD